MTPSGFALAPVDAGDRPVFEPAVDIHELPHALRMQVDLPGVLAENLRVRLEERLLVIRARVDLPIPPNGRIVFQQFRVGDFERSFLLTEEIDATRITARLERGVLHLHLPKTEGYANSL
jgi:HSP20 family molecular chaperone IbpA